VSRVSGSVTAAGPQCSLFTASAPVVRLLDPAESTALSTATPPLLSVSAPNNIPEPDNVVTVVAVS